MKKILAFFLIVVGWIFYVNVYKYNYFKQNIKPFFYLYFRTHPDFKTFSVSNIFFPDYNINDVADTQFFIKNIRFNPILKKISISNSIISGEVVSQLKEIIKNFEYLNCDFKIINFNDITILLDNKNNIKFLYGSLVHRKKQKDFIFEFNGYYKKIYFEVKGKLNKNGKLYYSFNFNSIPIKSLFYSILKLPDISIFNLNKSIKGKLEFAGNFDNISKISFSGVVDNSTLLAFKLIKKRKFYYFENGSINFNKSEDNVLNFKGKILNKSNWNFIFYSKSDNLEIPVNNTNLKFKEIDFNYSINCSDGENLNILKLSAVNLVINEKSYNFIKEFFKKTNYMYSIYIDNVLFDNITARNVDIHISDSNGRKSIEKFNFDIDNGKVLYSYIIRDNKFQWAINVKKLRIKKLVKFLLNKNINIDGTLKLNFLASGKNKKFIIGNGVIQGKNWTFKGISTKQLEDVFNKGDIVNINIIEKKNDSNNKGLSIISSFYSLIGVNDSSLILKNLIMDFTLFKLKLKGEININDLNNIILEGKYISSVKSPKDVIININLKNKFIQFIGK